jgi:SLA1 homology domain 1, SHD1
MYPHERSLVKKMQGRPFVLLGVNNDDEISTVREAIEKNNLNWRSFYDGGGGPIVRKFGIQAFPTIMIIDHTGEIIHANVRLRGKPLDREIERLVKAAEASGIPSSAGAPKRRKFVDKSGSFSVLATAVARDGDTVTLRKDDGSEVTVKIDSLSSTDQEYLKGISLPGPGDDESESESEEEVASEEVTENESSESFRTYQDSSGKFSVDAKFLEMSGDNVVLQKRDGSTIRVPLKRLSEKDQDYLRERQ